MTAKYPIKGIKASGATFDITQISVSDSAVTAGTGAVSFLPIVVSNNGSSVTVTAADAGKTYRLAHTTTILSLPTTGRTIGDTFQVQFTGDGEGVIDSGTGSVIQYLQNDAGTITPQSKQTMTKVYQYQLVYLQYVAAGVWAATGLGLA